jgi:hypothetical protein
MRRNLYGQKEKIQEFSVPVTGGHHPVWNQYARAYIFMFVCGAFY